MEELRAKELKAIKEEIKNLRSNKKIAIQDEKRISKLYDEKVSEYSVDNYYDRMLLNNLHERFKMEVSKVWEMYGNEANIYIIYKDGSHCTATGVDIVSGEIAPKLQFIAYARYSDGYSDYDTLTGDLVDSFGDLFDDENFNKKEEYETSVEIKFGTEWGVKHSV